MGGISMKPFNLDEYLANPSKKVVTRDGKLVKIRCTNYHPPQPVIAEVEGFDYATSFSSDGKYYRNRESTYDLFFVPEKHEGWTNVYRQDDRYRYTGLIHETKEEALKDKDLDYITTIKIEWEE